MNNTYHTSVLSEEVLAYLLVKPGNRYIDATFGGGGHTKAILDRGGLVLGIDTDEDAISNGKKTFKDTPNLTLVRANYSEIDRVAREKKIKSVDGILFDLGVSSHQFDHADRGFSFRFDGPLDMRMSQKLTVTAEDLVNGLSKKELVTLFEKLGEEWNARKIADKIVTSRKKERITSTKQLATIVENVSHSHSTIHPATKIFQALRIAVNDELNTLSVALSKAVRLLGPQGRLIVISFHSLEDRIVKDAFKTFSETIGGTVITKKPLLPTENEKLENSRSRSAKMRVFEKK